MSSYKSKTVLQVILYSFVTVSIASPQSVKLGATSTVNLTKVGIPIYYTSTGVQVINFPDGHIATSWDAVHGKSIFVWAETQSYIATGSTLESSTGAIPVIGDPPTTGAFGDGATTSGDRSHPNYFDNSGSWLFSIFRVNPGTFTRNPSSRHLIGFYHGEDHWYTDAAGPRAGQSYYHDPVAWNGVGYATSEDGGVSWTKWGPALGVPDLKPKYPNPSIPIANAPWGGIGNQCTVIDDHSDPLHPHWVTFFPMIASTGLTAGHGVTAAISYDPSSTTSSWYAYYNGGFNAQQQYKEGFDSPLPGLDGPADSDFNHYSLANPSVHWNTALNRWVMVIPTWDGSHIMISYSTNANPASTWSKPQSIITAPMGYSLAYATIIGTDHTGHLSDTESAASGKLYYALFDASNIRTMKSVPVTFAK